MGLKLDEKQCKRDNLKIFENCESSFSINFTQLIKSLSNTIEDDLKSIFNPGWSRVQFPGWGRGSRGGQASF